MMRIWMIKSLTSWARVSSYPIRALDDIDAPGRRCEFFRVYQFQSMKQSAECEHWSKVRTDRITMKLWEAGRRQSRMISGSLCTSTCGRRRWTGHVLPKQCPYLIDRSIFNRLRRERMSSIGILNMYPKKTQRSGLIRNWRRAPQNIIHDFHTSLLSFEDLLSSFTSLW